MGKYFDRFKKGVEKTDEKISKRLDRGPKNIPPGQKDQNLSADAWSENIEEDLTDEEKKAFQQMMRPQFPMFGFDDVNIKTAQKPESFHHFILENQYQDLERSIRGFKDVYNKDKEEWEIKRKQEHCFTDEEAEEILRTAQSHLATDIKLSYVSRESFPLLMDAIYKQISFIFRSISEYQYGRYGTFEKQYEMKVENLKIFLELMTRIQANYSRAIQGAENKSTHGSIKTQESLQGGQSLKDFNHLGRYS